MPTTELQSSFTWDATLMVHHVSCLITSKLGLWIMPSAKQRAKMPAILSLGQSTSLNVGAVITHPQVTSTTPNLPAFAPTLVPTTLLKLVVVMAGISACSTTRLSSRQTTRHTILLNHHPRLQSSRLAPTNGRAAGRKLQVVGHSRGK